MHEFQSDYEFKAFLCLASVRRWKMLWQKRWRRCVCIRRQVWKNRAEKGRKEKNRKMYVQVSKHDAKISPQIWYSNFHVLSMSLPIRMYIICAVRACLFFRKTFKNEQIYSKQSLLYCINKNIYTISKLK